MKLFFSSLVLFILLNNLAFSSIINIPDDYSTIQEGIDASTNGDTVLVFPGSYIENIRFNGHNILLCSMYLPTGDTTYIASTIIDGGSSGVVVSFENEEDTTAVICGFLIMNGYGGNGGGIYCWNSNPTIKYNAICMNYAENGGGIFCGYSNPQITHNRIGHNTAVENGGGIRCFHSSPLVKDNIIYENSAQEGGGIACLYSDPEIKNSIIRDNETGGGVYCLYSNPYIFSNTIARNQYEQKAGIYLDEDSNPTMVNNIIWANIPQDLAINENTPSINYCNLRGHWEGVGNLDEDPFFAYPDSINLNICLQSHCIDSGDPDLTDPDSTRSDIGYFFPEHPICDIGNIWYVSTTGDDTIGNGSYENPFRTIQHAIDISFQNDTVIALNGTYVETIEIMSKSIIIASNFIYTQDTLDIVNTVIDADSMDTAIKITSCDRNTAINGLTIKNGYGQGGYIGGGIHCNFSDPFISNCKLIGNYGRDGGGINCWYSNSNIQENTFKENTGYMKGGAICCYESNAVISNNRILQNYNIDPQYGSAAGIFCSSSDIIIEYNEIIGNLSYG